MPKRQKTWIEVNGERICAEMLAERCGLCVQTARSRVMKYARGEIGLETLLHKGPKRSDGTRTRHKVTGPNEEWLRMRRGAAKDVNFKAGSWERAHIPDRPHSAGRSRGRLGSHPDIEGEGAVAYSGQYRIRI